MTASDAPLSPRRRALHRAITVIGTAELAIGAISLVIIFVLMLTQAGQRFLPFDGLPWTGELSRFALIWMTFSAMGLLVTSNGHIALEVVDTVKNPAVVRVAHVTALLIIAATAVGLVVASASLVQTQGFLTSQVVRVPMSLVYLHVLVGSVSTVIRALISAVDVARNGPIPSTGAETEMNAV